MQLRITDLNVPVSLGVYAWEKRRKRKIIINLIVDYKPRNGDTLSATLDYDALVKKIREVAQARHYNLIETMVSAIGKAVLKFPLVQRAQVEIAKPGAVAGAGIAIVGEFAK